MNKRQSLLKLGIWLVIIPVLGIPNTWRMTLLTLTGLALIGVYVYRAIHERSDERKNNREVITDVWSERKPTV